MKNAILIHGKPKKEKFRDPTQPRQNVAHWFGWAAEELSKGGVTTYAPILPQPYNPNYEDCAAVIDSLPIHQETILIGRSMGAGLLLRRMSERQELIVSKLIMVAPWIDPRGNYGNLFNFTIDPGLPNRVKNGVTVFYSSKDDEQAKESLARIRTALPDVKYRDIPEYGHFMIGNTMTGPEFPELLEEVI